MSAIDRIDYLDGKPYSVSVTIKASDYDHTREREDYEIGKDIILMQYTGLKDKNGKEIYEGDIVKVRMYSGEIKTGYIKFSKKEACFTLNNGLFIGRHKREVIGNIYENEDLLT